MALVYAMLLGADSIDDCEVLRAGRTRRLVGRLAADAVDVGDVARVHLGHVRQLDRLLGGR